MKLAGTVSAAGGSSFTPTVNTFIWSLEAVTSVTAAIQEVAWGGEASSSTPMRTQVVRDSTVGSGSRTAGKVQRMDATLTTPGNAAFFSTAYGTSAPSASDAQASLVPIMSWNAYGGAVRWLAAPGEELFLNLPGTTTNQGISCFPRLGTGASSYGCVWTEF